MYGSRECVLEMITYVT
ncbi:hypothetical protein F383_19648 [Gossypium arboreum]|uniref:Uncharacterized protein n=1 Tax=Gossypium arboreum TaxID=29729 RepID=A0A0B0NQT3_GOSAR|nr:hypothetical protein F383_19648 [Gossypium arboreum]